MHTADGQAIAAHYTGGRDLGAAVRAAIRAAGHDPDGLDWTVLAPMDQFHTRGAEATASLAGRAAVAAGDRVLDVGGGVGGPARMLAATTGCHVTVLELTPAYARVGAQLTAAARLSDRVTFETGDATAMPFADGAFDLVWTQHSTMNVADKERLYAEAHRVLRPGGRLAMHEIVAGPAGPLHFPVPWAADPAISFLRSAAATRAVVEAAGFTAAEWEDVSTPSLAWIEARLAAVGGGPPPPLSIPVIAGPGFAPALHVLARNLTEGRAAVIEAVCTRR
jgi:ubiquinone/menaquinone biosynthesis C-methylase UbiE